MPCNVLDEVHYFVVRLFEEERKYFVSVNATEQVVTCSCRKFEMIGILCSHALKVLDTMNIKQISDQYIIKRWRRDVRNVHGQNSFVTQNVEDPKLVTSSRYRQLCPRMVKLASRCSDLQPAFELVCRGIDALSDQVENMFSSLNNLGDSTDKGNVGNEGIENVDPNILRVRGLKRKDGGYKG